MRTSQGCHRVERPQRHWSARGGRTSGTRGDKGATAVEMALLTPVVIMLIGSFSYGYRFWTARAGVQSAAAAAARAASLATSPDAGSAVAQQVALANLDTLGVTCRSHAITSDTADLASPAGTSGAVRVTVTCAVSMSDLVLPGTPGALTVTRSAQESVDTFRERRP